MKLVLILAAFLSMTLAVNASENKTTCVITKITTFSQYKRISISLEENEILEAKGYVIELNGQSLPDNAREVTLNYSYDPRPIGLMIKHVFETGLKDVATNLELTTTASYVYPDFGGAGPVSQQNSARERALKKLPACSDL